MNTNKIIDCVVAKQLFWSFVSCVFMTFCFIGNLKIHLNFLEIYGIIGIMNGRNKQELVANMANSETLVKTRKIMRKSQKY